MLSVRSSLYDDAGVLADFALRYDDEPLRNKATIRKVRAFQKRKQIVLFDADVNFTQRRYDQRRGEQRRHPLLF